MPSPRPLTDDEHEAWKALRVRVSHDQPWLNAALFRVTPVAVDGTDAVDSDAWGRVYCDFTLEDTKGMPTFASDVVDAIRRWLQGDTPPSPWHQPPDEDDSDGDSYDSVPGDEARELARLVASRFTRDPNCAAPDYGTDQLADWRTWAADLAGPPKVPWQNLLGGYLRQAVGWKAGSVDYTYSRPSRRRVPGIALPAMRHPLLDLAVVADVSPSLEPHLAEVSTEVWRISTAAGVDPRSVMVVACDSEVVATFPSAPTPPALPTGGGGTDMRVGIDHALTLRPRPGAVIVLTDAATPWPETPPAVPVIVGLIGTKAIQSTYGPKVPPWARLVHIDIPEAD